MSSKETYINHLAETEPLPEWLHHRLTKQRIMKNKMGKKRPGTVVPVAKGREKKKRTVIKKVEVNTRTNEIKELPKSPLFKNS